MRHRRQLSRPREESHPLQSLLVGLGVLLGLRSPGLLLGLVVAWLFFMDLLNLIRGLIGANGLSLMDLIDLQLAYTRQTMRNSFIYYFSKQTMRDLLTYYFTERMSEEWLGDLRERQRQWRDADVPQWSIRIRTVRWYAGLFIALARYWVK